MGVDPWTEENDEQESRGGEGETSADDHTAELEREARRRRDQFWSEGYREGIEEGKKESVQAGFNVGFREGATSGLAFGQCRGAAISVDIFAGQVPGSSEWKAKIAQTAAMVDHMTPRDAAKEAGMDFEKKYGNRDGDGDGVGDGKTESENTFAKKTADARAELESAGFKHRDFKLE